MCVRFLGGEMGGGGGVKCLWKARPQLFDQEQDPLQGTFKPFSFYSLLHILLILLSLVLSDITCSM